MEALIKNKHPVTYLMLVSVRSQQLLTCLDLTASHLLTV